MATKALSLTEFNRQVNIAILYLTENIIRLKFSKEALDALTADLESWKKIWEINQNKKKRNSMSVDDMHTLRKSFQKKYEQMQQSLKHSVAVVLTDDDYNNLFITKPGQRHTVPPITEIPSIHVTARRPRELDFEISGNGLPEFDQKGLLAVGDSVSLKWAIVNVGDSAPTDAQYSNFTTLKKANITLTFTSEEERKVLYIKAAYGNRHGIGPYSDAINVIIPD